MDNYYVDDFDVAVVGAGHAGGTLGARHGSIVACEVGRLFVRFRH